MSTERVQIAKPEACTAYNPLAEELFSDQPERLKILIGQESSVMSGPLNKLKHTAPLIAAEGHDLTVLLPSYSEEMVGPLPGVNIIETGSVFIEDFHLSVLYPAIRAKKLLREGNYDIVHAATPMRGPCGLAFLGGSVIDAAYELKMPIVAGAQTFNRLTAQSIAPKIAKPIVDKFICRQEKRMHSKAHINYSPSEAMDKYIQERNVSDSYLVRLKNGIDPMFNPERRSTKDAINQRVSWGVKEDELVLLVPGRLAAEKSLDRLEAVDGIMGTKIVVVGDGAEKGRLQKLLPDAVFTGRLEGEELANAYANGDILVLTSDAESYSQVLFEGMAAGLPVVTPNKGAFVELVKEDITGLKYESAEEFRRSVISLVNNPQQRMRMGQRGRNSIKGRTWEEETRKLLTIYRMAIYLNKNRSKSRKLTEEDFASLGLEMSPQTSTKSTC